MVWLHVEDVVGTYAGHDGRYARLCRRSVHRLGRGARTHQAWTRLVMGGRRIQTIEVEEFVAVDPVRREAGLPERAFDIRLLARQQGEAVIDPGNCVNGLATVKAIPAL